MDSDFAYFTFVALNDSPDRGIRRVDKLGRGPASTLITTSQVPLRVRVDSQNVYYRDDDGVVCAAAKDGSGNHMVFGNPGRAFLIDFDVNAFQVFWLWTDATRGGTEGLFRANADGSGFTALDTAGDNNWSGPRVDATAVFYWHNSSLMKRLK